MKQKCNGYRHENCTCGWGGEYHGGADGKSTDGASLPPAGTKKALESRDVCWPSRCPECSADVFFVRHNGGCVWFDQLGPPWPKHACMADAPDARWLLRTFPGGVAPGNRKVFGVVIEATVVESGSSAIFDIECPSGSVSWLFPYTLNPCETVGGLVMLELTPNNRIERWRFKAVDDMREAHEARLQAEERRKRAAKKRKETLADRERESARVEAQFNSLLRDTLNRIRGGRGR